MQKDTGALLKTIFGYDPQAHKFSCVRDLPDATERLPDGKIVRREYESRNVAVNIFVRTVAGAWVLAPPPSMLLKIGKVFAAAEQVPLLCDIGEEDAGVDDDDAEQCRDIFLEFAYRLHQSSDAHNDVHGSIALFAAMIYVRDLPHNHPQRANVLFEHISDLGVRSRCVDGLPLVSCLGCRTRPCLTVCAESRPEWLGEPFHFRHSLLSVAEVQRLEIEPDFVPPMTLEAIAARNAGEDGHLYAPHCRYKCYRKMFQASGPANRYIPLTCQRTALSLRYFGGPIIPFKRGAPAPRAEAEEPAG